MHQGGVAGVYPKGWVAVYYEDGVFLGFQIFLVEHRRFYGYQIWTEAGAEGFYSLRKTTKKLFFEFIEEPIQTYGLFAEVTKSVLKLAAYSLRGKLSKTR